jgi:hypothetical protein
LRRRFAEVINITSISIGTTRYLQSYPVCKYINDSAGSSSQQKRKKRKMKDKNVVNGGLSCLTRLSSHATKLSWNSWRSVHSLVRARTQVDVRLSRPRFELMVQLNRQISVCRPKKNLLADSRATIYDELLLPLKCLAHGVPLHCFTDYFQHSKAYASVCCNESDEVVKLLYTSEWLRLTTSTDLSNVIKLHKEAPGFPGMIGRLDCSHSQGSQIGLPAFFGIPLTVTPEARTNKRSCPCLHCPVDL